MTLSTHQIERLREGLNELLDILTTGDAAEGKTLPTAEEIIDQDGLCKCGHPFSRHLIGGDLCSIFNRPQQPTGKEGAPCAVTSEPLSTGASNVAAEGPTPSAGDNCCNGWIMATDGIGKFIRLRFIGEDASISMNWIPNFCPYCGSKKHSDKSAGEASK